MRFPIIEIGASGVDMQINPLFLQSSKAAFARNLTFNEATIVVRPDIEYRDLGIAGKFQGSTYFTPSTGLSAVSYSSAPSALATVVDGQLRFNPISDIGISNTPFEIGDRHFDGDTYLWGAENYLNVVNENSSTYWWDGGTDLTPSPGIDESCSDQNSHDTLENSEIRQWLPNCASVGHYIHGRNHVSQNFSMMEGCEPLNSKLYVSDILTKRGPFISDDILKMEEAMLDSMGGPLVAPSQLGKTVVMQTMLTGSDNGEGALVDFRECGVVIHDTLQQPRETLIGEAGDFLQQGWDEKRISSVKLQSVSATGRYAVYQLPDDIWFRSEFGFHFFKKTLGQGTLKDETLNHESHDIQPLIDLDCDSDLSGAATGHWLHGDRFMGTVGFTTSSIHSSSPMGQGIAVMNQATTFSEDDTPRPQWEGVWTMDCDMFGIHNFTRAGRRSKDRQFGFTASDNNTSLFFGEFQKSTTGVDRRQNIERPVDWSYVSGAFPFTGIKNIDTLRSGVIDMVADTSTGDVVISVRTDETQCWEEWATISPCSTQKSLVSKSFGEPPKKSREATWFQFRIEGEGYIEIRTFDVMAVKLNEKDDGRNHCVPLCSEDYNYFR